MRHLLARRKRDERGVVAILVALLALLICMFAAYAVDIGMQVNTKHQLNDTLDAAAQAGAYELPGSSITARAQALAFATAHDPTETGTLAPNVDFWCVVASKVTAGLNVVDATQIPSTCYPGPAPYTVGATYGDSRLINCSAVLCAIPCVEPVSNTGTPKIACNTIRVFQGRDVPFAFAPAGGISKGTTGTVVSVACKGSCGTIAPNPMDVAVVADRTESMALADVDEMVAGIKGMLQQMTPSQQYVSLGTIGRSSASSTSQSGNCTDGQLTWPSTSVTSGKFMPVSFSDNYVDGGVLEPGSALVKGVECIGTANRSVRETGTSLAAPMKAATRYLLGIDDNNLSVLGVRTAPVTKVLIFETDGQPNERTATGGSTLLSSPDDPFSSQMSLDPTGVMTTQPDTSSSVTVGTVVTKTVTHNKTLTYTYNGGANACQNLVDVAAQAKAQGILVIMIAYNMTGKQCFDWDGYAAGYVNRTNYVAATDVTPGPEAETTTTSGTTTTITKYETKTVTKHVKAGSSTPVLNVMAQAASPTRVVDGGGGVASAADSDCSSVAKRTAENADGDYFFCAASGTDMAPIFRTALSQASKGIKLIKMP
jgi:Flp pilus assembly protein TadG